jgi:3-phosphoshikimate 1-carboxyvinyltransferase
MRTSVTIRRPEGPVRGRIALPPGKSVANRALILAALAGDIHCVKNFGNADDTRILHRLLGERPEEMHCGDGGTTFRFLLAWACVQDGEERIITGNARLLKRPHAPLVKALRDLGADIEKVENGFRVRGNNLKGGTITLHSPESSQFISALLMVAPCFREGLQLHWTGTRLSGPYVRMTLKMLARFGAEAREKNGSTHVTPGPLKPVETPIPADWSAASFWFELAALAPDAQLLLAGLEPDGLQGDEIVAKLFEDLVRSTPAKGGVDLEATSNGEKSSYKADLSNTPDLFQPLAFALAARGRAAEFTGLHNLALKETDRLRAVAEALKTLGCLAEYSGSTFTLRGPVTNLSPPPFDPQGDHRMAMALAPLALVCEQVTILDPVVVAKSYPGFWEDLKKAGFSVEFSGKD